MLKFRTKSTTIFVSIKANLGNINMSGLTIFLLKSLDSAIGIIPENLATEVRFGLGFFSPHFSAINPCVQNVDRIHLVCRSIQWVFIQQNKICQLALL